MLMQVFQGIVIALLVLHVFAALLPTFKYRNQQFTPIQIEQMRQHHEKCIALFCIVIAIIWR